MPGGGGTGYAGGVTGRIGLAAALSALLLVAAAPVSLPRFDATPGGELAHGARLARVLGCAGCHNTALTGNDWSEPGVVRLWSANLTRSASRYNRAEFAAMVRTGERPDGSALWFMPSHLFTRLGEAEVDAIFAWIANHPPTGRENSPAVLEHGARKLIAKGEIMSAMAAVDKWGNDDVPYAGTEHFQASHIVRATCAECHGMDLRGRPAKDGEAARPDLRMVAAYPPADFTRLLKTGVATGGRDVGLMSQVGRSRYSRLTASEVEAVRAYLTALADRD